MRADVVPWTVRGMGLAVGVAMVVGLIALGIAASSVLLLLFLAILLGSALEPFVGQIRDRLPLGRGATILVVYLAFFVTVIGLALVVVPAAIGQGQTIMARLPAFFDQLREWASTLRPATLSRSVIASCRLGRATPPRSSRPTRTRSSRSGPLAASAAITLATLLTLVFFWLVEHARLQRYLLAYLPADSRAGAREAWNEIETRLGLWVRGQLILMGAMGLATGVAYTAARVCPGALLLGLIAALTEAIPIVGPLLGAIPAVLVAATVSPQLAVVVAGVYIVLQLLEGSVLVPIVMRNTIGISPLLVLLSLLVGGAAGGLVGAFLAVPIAASLEIAVSRLQAREVPVAEDPAAIETPDEEQIDAYGESLPDSLDGADRSVAARVSRAP